MCLINLMLIMDLMRLINLILIIDLRSRLMVLRFWLIIEMVFRFWLIIEVE